MLRGINYSKQPGRAYYSSSIGDFLLDKSDEILGQLVRNAFDNNDDQRDAWINQISELQTKLKTSGTSGHIIFEYDIIRLGKRIDVVLLIRHMVFSLEFKNGKKVYSARDAEQAEDYALDLKNFHKESENLYVCPILVATEADDYLGNDLSHFPDKEVSLQYTNSKTMMGRIQAVCNRYGEDKTIDFDTWFNSPYYPTPTIIQAAVEAYKSHTVSEIARSEAGQDAINRCEKAISQVIDHAEKDRKKCICFVTGVPGAGKTLVGLDLACQNQDEKSERHAVYLSGNDPLVAVLRMALAKNIQSKGKTAKESRLYVRTFIQGIYEFRKEALAFPDRAPYERIVVFDEAQRCWDQKHLTDWLKKKSSYTLSESEPHYLIGTMNRHKDWSVIICLVGLGQDIYNGEVGINEWFRSTIEDFPDWELYYSPDIFNQLEDKDIDRPMIESCSNANKLPELHLSTSIRSFRSSKQSEFVDCLLNIEPKTAKSIYKEIQNKYQIWVTRDIAKAKTWARKQVRGSEGCGIVACSSAQRLKPDGIYVPTEIDVENWFLAPKDDIRSSNALEIVASEFKIQGLEIDWGIVCWDADLRYSNGKWEYYNFRGNDWQRRKNLAQQRYLINSYRVLLTRARQGMVIFVPVGDDPKNDKTRNHAYYDSIYSYLTNECGIEILP